MQIEDLYKVYFRSELSGRYITFSDIDPLLIPVPGRIEIFTAGSSENDIPIKKAVIGSGDKIILAWSQMHGNESTTTKAVFDLIKFFSQAEVMQPEIERFLATNTLVILPMLNPDGADAYTRENSNNIDLNRDALMLSQRESRVLRSVFDEMKPDLCLNLHDQRTIYGLPNRKPATVSFLAPSADTSRKVTAARTLAMKDIARIASFLEHIIPGQIGRYDDSYNANCVGDTFTAEGTPTILFEAGHFPEDYQRERTRALVFFAFLELFNLIDQPAEDPDYREYFKIPENRVNFKDILVRNVRIAGYEKSVTLGIQYKELLDKNKIRFIPMLDAIDVSADFCGHQEIEGNGAEILLNYQKNIQIGEELSTIIDKNSEKVMFSSKK